MAKEREEGCTAVGPVWCYPHLQSEAHQLAPAFLLLGL